MATSRAPLVLALVSSAAAYNAAVVQSRPLRPAVLQRVSITAAVAEATDAPPVAARAPRPPRGDGEGGGGGSVLVLTNPRYAQRIAPPPPPPRPQPSASQQQERRPQAPRAPRADGGGPATMAPPADLGSSGKPAGKRREFGADAKKASPWKEERREGPRNQPKGGNMKRGRNQFQDDNEFTARASPRSVAPARRGKKGKKGKMNYPPVEVKGPAQVAITGPITVGELATALDVGAAEVVKDLMKKGVLASITQSIEPDLAAEIAEGFGADVTRDADDGDDDDFALSAAGVIDDEEDAASLLPRPPVVTVMGHVDHGKTSLLDALRAADVAGGEAGGVTQHIGAYQIDWKKEGDDDASDAQKLTFIDTPGHSAFDEMRSRGANITDVVILVVAADDGVKEQTVESIRAAKQAGCPLVVAINKIDKEGADPSVVKQGLLEHEVVLEDFGGETQSVEVSAKEGTGLDKLIEQVLLQSELLDLKANPERLASGVVLEARQVTGQGAVATALVQKGTLRPGDVVVAGAQWGRVKLLLDEAGEKVDAAAPSRAVELVGLGGLPAAGDSLVAVENEAAAREIAAVRQQLERERRASSLFVARSTADRESFLGAAAADALPLRVLDFVVKSDVQGSAEALASAIEALEAADDKLQVKTRVLRSGAGAVTSEDVMLASVSNAIVIGFNSQASRQTADEAAKANIELKEYSVVYDALDEIKAMMDKLIRPPPSKQLGSIVGTADVLQTFKIADVGKVAGCRLLDGYIRVGCNIRILRGNLIVYEGKLRSLRSVKSVVEQVDAPNECGVSFDDYQGMEVDDRVEVYLPKEGQGTDFE